MVVLSKIYTKTGDKGKTGLGNGKRVPKSSLRIDVIGAVDEANAALGLCRLHASHNKESDILLYHLQNDLFDVGADLCLPEGDGLRIAPSQVKFLEQTIDYYNSSLPSLRSFILPGGSALSSYFHLARTIVRRAERLTCALQEKLVSDKEPELNSEIIKYLNRLSDLLFVLCRVANHNGENDVLWVPGAHR
ncbi:MAG: cob(I)yrinic acid a,c-diamide adenosyltransferase [Alphaproteobacteria bacterium]|nr:cob(I)yrinic acid a,c-diamide adenosyltransferase [Alphaproteobacteria bacterium]